MESARDPDGGAVTYDLVIDDDPGFGSPLASLAGLSDTTHTVEITLLDMPLYWRVTAHDPAGSARLAAPAVASFTIPDVSGVAEPGDPGAADTPPVFRCGTPYPNPARGPVALDYTLPAPATVHVAVFDVTGRMVRLLAAGERPAGEARLAWDGRDGEGRSLPSGIYFLRLAAGARVETRRVTRMR